MLDTLKHTSELPDNLRSRLEAAATEGEDFAVTLDDDEAMAMTEMCEWYVRKDPATGGLTESGKVYDAIIEAIDDADAG
jgi:hypothetical protein